MADDFSQATAAAGAARAARALCVSELSYRRLFEAAQDGILILDAATGRVTDVNPFLVKLLGFSRDEMVGKTVGELSPFKDVVSNQAMLELLQKDRYVRYHDLPLETKDGRKVDVEFVSNVYSVGEKQVIQCNIREITDRKRAEEALRTSQLMLGEIINALPARVFWKDKNLVYLGCNTVFARDAGFAGPKDMIGKNDNQMVWREQAEAYRRDDWQVIESGQPKLLVEESQTTPAGKTITLLSSKLPLRDAKGKIIGMLGTYLDITARKEAEASRDRLATAVEQASETIVITDTKGTILYANPAFEKTSGYTRAEALGQNPRVLKSGKQDAEFYRQMWAVLQRGEVWNGHFINRRKDGTLYEEEANISPVRDAAGKIINYVAVKRDVTHEVQLETQFRQAQKMEVIGQLAGGIAHDFNNILACIVGYLFLAKAAAKSPEVTGYLEHITKATDRAVDLVNQILTFSRQNKPEREPVVLNHVVLEALKLLRASLPASVRIQTELTETPAVLANATAIHQVIMNLGTNAWHAMRGQPGTLKVEMSVLDVDAAFASSRPDLRPGRYVRLAVSDTGCGMDAATQARIFEPFFTTNGAGGGTGLGLAVVHGIMKTHEGAISVYSHLGEGTTFNLYFPVLETAASAPKIASRPIPRGAGEQILFVDDEVPLATLGQQVLDRLGYRVTMMTSPVAALAAVRAEPEKFDLVITDLSMPVMDGAKLGAELLLLRPGLPIILTTGFSSFMTAGKVRELGFRELMVKPGTVQTLGETVHRVLHPPAAAGVNTP